jgi:predicted nucleic acid-binding protein
MSAAPDMGLLLDSSILVGAYGHLRPLTELLETLRTEFGAHQLMLSAITVLELEHAFWRAGAPGVAVRRRAYLDQLLASVPVQSFTMEIADLAGHIGAKALELECNIPLADLQIGATALYFHFDIVASNGARFEGIPGLKVREMR